MKRIACITTIAVASIGSVGVAIAQPAGGLDLGALKHER